MYFSTSIPEGRLSTSNASLYDISPLPTPTSDSTTYQTATCSYPSWPRRPSLHSSSSSTSSRSNSPTRPTPYTSTPATTCTSSRHQVDPEVINAWIPDDDLFPEGYCNRNQGRGQIAGQNRGLDLRAYYDQLPAESPVGSLPRHQQACSLASMSPREMARRTRAEEAKRVAAAILCAKEAQAEQRRRRRAGKRSSV